MKLENSAPSPSAIGFHDRSWSEAPERDAEGRQIRRAKTQIPDTGEPAFYPAPPQHWPRVFPGL